MMIKIIKSSDLAVLALHIYLLIFNNPFIKEFGTIQYIVKTFLFFVMTILKIKQL